MPFNVNTQGAYCFTFRAHSTTVSNFISSPTHVSFVPIVFFGLHVCPGAKLQADLSNCSISIGAHPSEMPRAYHIIAWSCETCINLLHPLLISYVPRYISMSRLGMVRVSSRAVPEYEALTAEVFHMRPSLVCSLRRRRAMDTRHFASVSANQPRKLIEHIWNLALALPCSSNPLLWLHGLYDWRRCCSSRPELSEYLGYQAYH